MAAERLTQFLRNRLLWIILALLPLIPLYKAVLMGDVIGPFEQIVSPEGVASQERAWDILQADAALQSYPWRDLVLESWSKGRAPLWNPYQLGGTELAANSQSGAFYPLHILMGLLRIDPATSLALGAWFHLAVAGLGVALLSRRLGAERLGAFVGGAFVILSPFFVSWSVLSSVPTTICWIPWILVGVHRAMSEREVWWKAAPLAWVAIPVALMFLGGHLQFGAFGAMGAAVWALTLAVMDRKERKWSRLPIAAIGGVLGVMMALPHLLPVLEFSQRSHRLAEATAEGYQAYASSAIQPFELIGLVFPGATGRPGELFDAESGMPAYWPGFVKLGANFAESAIGLGPIVLGLVALAFMRRRRESGMVAVLGVFALAVAFATPLARLMYFGLPGWSATGSPGRAAVLFVLAAGVMAALGWPSKLEMAEGGKRSAVWIGAVALGGMLATFLMAAVLDGSLEFMFGDPYVMAQVASAAPGILLATLGAVGAGVLLWKGRETVAAGVAVLVLVVAIGLNIVPTSGRETVDRIRAVTVENPHDRVFFVNEDWSFFSAVPTEMMPNFATIARVRDVAGYDSLLDRETVELLRAVNRGNDPAPPVNGNIMLVKPGYDEVALADMGVDVSEFEPTFEGGSWGRLSHNASSAEFVLDEPGRIVIAGSGAGTVNLYERRMPIWRFEGSGVEDVSEDGPWFRFEASEGDWRIELRTHSQAAWNGFFAMLIAVVVLGATGLLGWARGSRATIE